MDFSARQRTQLLNLARDVIRRALAGDQSPPAQADPSSDAAPDPALHQPAGCFVTLHRLPAHALRGCIGRIDASLPLADAVRAMAGGVLDDPRFQDDPVRLDELADLELEISVISPLRPAADPLAFDPDVHGIYLTLGHRAGCFLPQVAQETGWGREQLLDRLCTEKMGLPARAWRDAGAQLSIFTAVTLGPEPFVPAGRTPW